MRIGRLIVLIGVLIFFIGLLVTHGEVTDFGTRLFATSLLFLLLGIFIQSHDLEG